MEFILCDQCGEVINNAHCMDCKNLFSYSDNNGICPFCGSDILFINCMKCDKIVWIFPYFCPHCRIIDDKKGFCPECGTELKDVRVEMEKMQNK